MATKMKVEELEALDGSNIRSRLKMQSADRDYFISNYRNLLKKYRNHWVVISEGKLIMSESDPDRLLEALNKTRRQDGLVYYLADPEDVMLL